MLVQKTGMQRARGKVGIGSKPAQEGRIGLAAEYRKLLLSNSTMQMMTVSARQPLLDDIEGFVRQQFDDQVTRPLVVTLTTARLSGHR